MTWRRVDNQIYLQPGPEPSADDTFIGSMTSAALAEIVVKLANTSILAAAGYPRSNT